MRTFYKIKIGDYYHYVELQAGRLVEVHSAHKQDNENLKATIIPLVHKFGTSSTQ